MGFRIRKSIKIAPGIKYNFNKSGGSLSVKGLVGTHNISKRGVKSTYTLKGTGISYVQQSPSSSTNNRSVYRELVESQRKEEKQRNIQDQQSIVNNYNYKIHSLSNILKNRDKQLFNWEKETASRGKYQSSKYISPKFIEPEQNFTKESIEKQILENDPSVHQIHFFLFGIALFGLAFILLFINAGITLLMSALAGVFIAIGERRSKKILNDKTTFEWKRQKIKFDRYRQQCHTKFIKEIEIDRARYSLTEEEKEKIWNQEEDFRKKLREAGRSEDTSIFSELLEIELSNEDLPIPLVFDIEFNDIQSVKIFMEIPELDIVPEEEIKLTKTGKISSKKMTQKARFKIYSDVCTGLTLRLIYETFRVLSMVTSVEIYGVSEIIDPATGHLETITSLFLKTSREDFDKFNLDHLDPSLAFESIGGQFACNKRGELSSIKI